nr:PPC domain-containing protein [Deltaproteobacteria bacterium]
SEQCTVTGGGDVYVAVNGYATTSNFNIKITYTEGGGTVTPPPPPPVVTHVNTTGNVALNEMKVFTVDVVANRRIVLRTTSLKDVDLYIQMGVAPTTNAYVQRAFTSSGNETITYTPTSNGKLHIGVHGYEAAAFSVRSADM